MEPFGPMKDTNLKHLTLKTAFLLALASGKRRSEIHAWVGNKVSNLGQWEKVVLFPSSDFIGNSKKTGPCAGPEVLFGLNQKPKSVSIPSFYLL